MLNVLSVLMVNDVMRRHGEACRASLDRMEASPVPRIPPARGVAAPLSAWGDMGRRSPLCMGRHADQYNHTLTHTYNAKKASVAYRIYEAYIVYFIST